MQAMWSKWESCFRQSIAQHTDANECNFPDKYETQDGTGYDGSDTLNDTASEVYEKRVMISPEKGHTRREWFLPNHLLSEGFRSGLLSALRSIEEELSQGNQKKGQIEMSYRTLFSSLSKNSTKCTFSWGQRERMEAMLTILPQNCLKAESS